jgi:hypothetical protein
MNKTLFEPNGPEVDQSVEMFQAPGNKVLPLASSPGSYRDGQNKTQSKHPAPKNDNKPLFMKPVYKARKHDFF